MKNTAKSLLAAVLVVAAASCGEKTNPEIPSGTGSFCILNNGSMGMNNSCISLYDADSKALVPEAFANTNGKVLGDTAQDMLVCGEELYVTVNLSRTVFVTDKELKIRASITASLPDGTVLSPRYLAEGGNGKVYVTYYEGYLGEIDRLDHSVRVTPVGPNPEGCAFAAGKVFTSNSGGASYPDYDNSVSVVDPETFSEIREIEVNTNPATMKAAGNRVYVFSMGDFGGTPAKVQCIDAETLEVSDMDCENPTAIAVGGECLYIMCGGYGEDWKPLPASIYRYDTGTNACEGSFISDGTLPAPAYSLSAAGGYIWVGCSDYITDGDMYVFDSEGRLYDKFDTRGINPITVTEL